MQNCTTGDKVVLCTPQLRGRDLAKRGEAQGGGALGTAAAARWHPTCRFFGKVSGKAASNAMFS